MESPEFDAIVMLDCDHAHPENIIAQLKGDAEQHPYADVIGALCFRRAEPYDPCAWILDRKQGKYVWPVPWQKGLVECDAVGFGAVLFRRHCFEVLTRPWFYYDYSKVKDGLWPSEDMTFCERARKAGLRIFVDTTLTSPHIFEGEVDEGTCLSYLAADPKAATVEEVQE
jgi:hypothetical protein